MRVPIHNRYVGMRGGLHGEWLRGVGGRGRVRGLLRKEEAAGVGIVVGADSDREAGVGVVGEEGVVDEGAAGFGAGEADG